VEPSPAGATATIRQNITGRIGQAKHIIQLAVDQDSTVGGDAGAVEFQPRTTAEMDPRGAVIRFTR